jgi:hypothetical protein
MPSLIGTQIAGSGGVELTEHYLRVRQSPGAAYADKDGNVIVSSPLLTFNTPNLQMFKVLVEGVDLTATPGVSNSNWSKAIRAIQVTSEVFGVFAPAVTEGDSTFCFLAPDFNTNTGAASVTGSVQTAIAERGGDFSVVEQALADALGVAVAAVTVYRAMVVGDAVVDEVAPV